MDAQTRRFYSSINNTHKPFDIMCKECGNNVVWLEDTLEFSRAKGPYGSLKLVCEKCSNEHTILKFG